MKDSHSLIAAHQSLLLFLTLILILGFSSQSNAQPESIDSTYRPAGVIFGIEYVNPQFTGKHVMNQSFSDWRGFNIKIGLSIYDRAEIILTEERIYSDLTDRRYVAGSTSEGRIRKVSISVPILSRNRFLYLSPDIGLGRIKTNFSGEIQGGLFEIGNNFAYHATDCISVVGRIAYQRTKYDITTNESLLPLFEISHAVYPSIGFRLRSRITKEKRFVLL